MIGFLQRYNVGTRLSAAFGLLILLSCGLVVAGLMTLAQARERMDAIVKRNLTILGYVCEIQKVSSDVAINLRNIVLPTTRGQNLQFAKAIERERARYSENHDSLYAIPVSDATAAHMRKQIDDSYALTRAANQKVLDLGMEDKDDLALAVLTKEAGPATDKWQQAIDVY